MAYLLHIDTSSDKGVVALGLNGALIAVVYNEEARNHAATINLMIGDVLLQGGISLQQVSGVVVCGGPGSYTGLRIGLATAKGICYALDIPLFLHNKLMLLARSAWEDNGPNYELYGTVLQARREEYFVACYNNMFITITDPVHINEKDLVILLNGWANSYIVSDSVTALTAVTSVQNLTIKNHLDINLISWLKVADDDYNCNKNVILSSAEPFYLKQVFTHN